MGTQTIYIPEIRNKQHIITPPKGFRKNLCVVTHKSINDSVCFTGAHEHLAPYYTYYHVHYTNIEYKAHVEHKIKEKESFESERNVFFGMMGASLLFLILLIYISFKD